MCIFICLSYEATHLPATIHTVALAVLSKCIDLFRVKVVLCVCVKVFVVLCLIRVNSPFAELKPLLCLHCMPN